MTTIPTPEQIRANYVGGCCTEDDTIKEWKAAGERFDAWLAADRKAQRAEAWDEGRDAGVSDETRASKCTGSSGCDCTAPTANPYRIEAGDHE